MIHIISYVWGDKYDVKYVDRLLNGINRNINGKVRVGIVSPHPDDLYLTDILGCFARLRTFDPEWQASIGVKLGDRIVCMDLDLIITGSMNGLFDRDETFTILQGVNSSNPNPYNGSLWMLKAGEHSHVWSEFSLDKAREVPFYAFPDDQAWFHHMIPDAGAFGPQEGVYAFQKPGWPKGEALPKNARIVAFPGHRDPSQFEYIPWVKEYWA